MTVFSVLWGPYETFRQASEVCAVVRTDQGDMEMMFPSFNKYYDFMRGLPKEITVD